MGFPSFDSGASEYQEFYIPASAPDARSTTRTSRASSLKWLFPILMFSAGVSAFWLSGTAMTSNETTQNAVQVTAPAVAEAPQDVAAPLRWNAEMLAVSAAPNPAPAEAMVVLSLSELEDLQAAKEELAVARSLEAEAALHDLLPTEKLVDIEDVRQEQLVTLAALPKVVEVIEGVQSAAFSCVETLRDVASMSTVYFESGSAELDANARSLVQRVGAAAAKCPEAQVQISGHSDSSGSDLANLNLSWLRAESALRELESQDFAAARFEAVGFGARLPSSQGDVSDFDQDRRVEFKVILAPRQN